MKSDFGKIDEKLDDMIKHLGSIDVTLASQAISLDHHIKRTEIAEQRIEALATQVTETKNSTLIVKGMMLMLGAVVTLFGAIAGLWQAYKS